tara:strand:- start:74 stop:583 length:510 start_codon:yes stop_codon:yes gene_type:complete
MSKSLLTIQLDRRSRELLSKIGNHAGSLNLKNSFNSIGRQYRKEVSLIFARKQVRQPNLKWPDLTERTKIDKAKKGFGSKGILERTGELRRSMTSRSSSDNISTIGKNFGVYGSSNKYGNYHDNVKGSRKKIPLRNFSIPSQSTYGVFLRIIEEDIGEQLKYLGVKIDR